MITTQSSRKILNQEIGKTLTTKEVADYLGWEKNTVRKYYLKLGGLRIGKKYIFTERRLADALLQQSEEKMDFTSNERGKEETGSIFDKEGSQGIRSEVSKVADRELEQEVRDDLLGIVGS